MNIRDAAYTNADEDYREVCEFLDALATQDPWMLWESGRMNFWRYSVHGHKDPRDPFFQENAHLWRAEDGALVALFISEYGQDDFFVEVMPEYHGLYPAIFGWLDDHWATPRMKIETDVFSEDRRKIEVLEAHGFQFKRHFENERIYDLDEVDLGYSVEDGFVVQAFSESLNYASRVELVQSAFDRPEYSEAQLRTMMSSPDYIDAYNLVVVSPEGKHVAYCVGWHEAARDHAGYIEPLGTHRAYRRRGFATAVIKECFRRMKANGIKTVEIASGAEPNVSNFLYDALGPKIKREVHRYSRAM